MTLSPCQLVAWNLENARRARGWSQQETARLLKPLLGYRLSRAAFSKMERSLSGRQIRRFNADEIVALARLFEVPVGYFFRVPEPHLGLHRVVVNAKPGNPRARVTSRPLSRDEMIQLAVPIPEAPADPAERHRQAQFIAEVVAAAVKIPPSSNEETAAQEQRRLEPLTKIADKFYPDERKNRK